MARMLTGMIAPSLLMLLVAAAPTTQSALSQDVQTLTNIDPTVRKAAAARLWSAGDAAIPLLRAATSSGNPQLLRVRAQRILQDILDHLSPSSAPELVEAVHAYHAANGQDRGEAISRIRKCGAPGMIVLLHLYPEETDPWVRQFIVNSMSQMHSALVAFIRQGDWADADAVMDLQVANAQSDYSHFCAAYWLMRGKLPERLAELRAHHTKYQFPLLSALDKAAGDRAAAVRDARASGNDGLTYLRLEEQADWPALATFLQKDPPHNPNIDLLTDRCIIYRVAGLHDAAAQQLQALLHEDADPKIEDWRRSQQGFTLCLADDVQDGITKMIAAGNRGDAAKILATQLDFASAFALASPQKGKAPANEAMLNAYLAPIYSFVGQPDHAKAAIIRARKAAHDYYDWLYTCLSARQLGFNDQADQCVLDAIKAGVPANQVCYLMNDSLYASSTDADWWRRFLLTQMDPRTAMSQARTIVDGRFSPEKLKNLSQQMEQWSQTQPSGDQPAILGAIAATLENSGRAADAAEVYQRRANAFPTIDAWMALGDCRALLQQWPAAAGAYAKAMAIDPEPSMPLFLHGWALTQAGDARTGRAEMDEAHFIALGDVGARSALFKAATARGLGDDAHRERAMLEAIADPDDYPMQEMLQTFAYEDAQQDRYADAARKMILSMLTEGSWVEPEDYVKMPATIHRFQALDQFAHHDVTGAMAEARLAFEDKPDEADGTADLVRAADNAGAAADANALFEMADDKYRLAVQQYPSSAPLLNLAAWFEARSHRKLDDALAAAERAVKLDPANGEYLDTLAETYYQQHDFKTALATEQRAIHLDSGLSSRLARFQLAVKTGVADSY